MKKYGPFTVDQLEQSISIIDQIEHTKLDLQDQINSKPDVLRKLLPPPRSWVRAYEMSFPELIAALAYSTGMITGISSALKSEDISQAILDLDNLDGDNKIVGCPDEIVNEGHVIGLYFSLIRSVESMSMYGRYLDELVADARNGSDSAIYKAVQIDKSILSAPAIADRITLAELEQDSQFFEGLSKAVQGTKVREPSEQYSKLRYVLYILEQAQVLDQLSIEDEYDLFCIQLCIYPNSGEDPAKSLHQFISRWKKNRST